MTEELSNPEQAFDKALNLLDRGEGQKGEALLELVVSAARAAAEPVLLARALCVLGDVLHEQGRAAEARDRLLEVLRVEVEEPDVIAYEQQRARDILGSKGA